MTDPIDMYRLHQLALHAVPSMGHWDHKHQWSIEFETGLFLYGLVRRMKPQYILEAGTHYGFSAAYMGCALADDGRSSKLVTLDLDRHEGVAEQLWGVLGIQHYIEPQIADSRKYVPVYRPIELLFLDTDHTHGHVMQEWWNFAPHMAHRGIVAIHDTAYKEMGDIINHIVSESRLPMKVIEFPNMRGLTLLQVEQQVPE